MRGVKIMFFMKWSTGRCKSLKIYCASTCVSDTGGYVEVREMCVAVVIEEDVVGLDVPVEDASRPEEVEGSSDLGANEANHLLREVERSATHVKSNFVNFCYYR